jgi:hypothetical protein
MQGKAGYGNIGTRGKRRSNNSDYIYLSSFIDWCTFGDMAISGSKPMQKRLSKGIMRLLSNAFVFKLLERYFYLRIFSHRVG